MKLYPHQQAIVDKLNASDGKTLISWGNKAGQATVMRKAFPEPLIISTAVSVTAEDIKPQPWKPFKLKVPKFLDKIRRSRNRAIKRGRYAEADKLTKLYREIRPWQVKVLPRVTRSADDSMDMVYANIIDDLCRDEDKRIAQILEQKVLTSHIRYEIPTHAA